MDEILKSFSGASRRVEISWDWAPFSKSGESLFEIKDLESELKKQCLNFKPLIDTQGLEFVTVCGWLQNSVWALNNFRKASPWSQLKVIEKLYGAAHAQSCLVFERLQ